MAGLRDRGRTEARGEDLYRRQRAAHVTWRRHLERCPDGMLPPAPRAVVSEAITAEMQSLWDARQRVN